MKGVFIVVILLFGLVACTTPNNESIDKYYCKQDSDCIPDTCCHSTGCVNKHYSPDCEESFCTTQCEEGTLDCGGKCTCQDNKCTAILQ